MQVLTAIWIITFFFFALILIFVWSKLVVVSGKIKSITGIIKNCDDIKSDLVEVEKILTAQAVEE